MHPAYPHESTGDQWFSESQFESYRALGSHILETMCAAGDEEEKDAPLSLDAFIDRVRRYLERTRPRPG